MCNDTDCQITSGHNKNHLNLLNPNDGTYMLISDDCFSVSTCHLLSFREKKNTGCKLWPWQGPCLTRTGLSVFYDFKPVSGYCPPGGNSPAAGEHLGWLKNSPTNSINQEFIIGLNKDIHTLSQQ